MILKSRNRYVSVLFKILISYPCIRNEEADNPNSSLLYILVASADQVGPSCPAQ